MSSRNVERLFHHVRDACIRYGLIASGDRVAVGVSGGKDSLVLLHALKLLLQYTPLRFQVSGITLDLGYGQDFSEVEAYCRSLGFDYQVVPTQIGQVVFQEHQADNPCALCSHLRRGCLNRHALALNCNKVALAHNLDDALATLFMSAFYNSRFQVYTPATFLSRTGLTVIRPLTYCNQDLIRKLVKELELPVVENPCPAAGHTRRTAVEEWLKSTETLFPHARIRLLNAWENLNPSTFWTRGEQLFDQREL